MKREHGAKSIESASKTLYRVANIGEVNIKNKTKIT